MVISLYFYNTLVIRFQIVRSIFSNENTMVILALHIIGSITEVSLSTTLAEALVGDITPMDGVKRDKKNRQEEITMDYFTNSLLRKVNGGITGREIKDIWHEHEDGETLESKFVRDVDKIKLVLQMVDYERVHKHKLVLGDSSWVASRIVMPEVKKWADEVLREREEFWGERPHVTYLAEVLPEEKSLAQKLEYYGKA
jgi:putative hydrolase of HD superfamily